MRGESLSLVVCVFVCSLCVCMRVWFVFVCLSVIVASLDRPIACFDPIAPPNPEHELNFLLGLPTDVQSGSRDLFFFVTQALAAEDALMSLGVCLSCACVSVCLGDNEFS